MLGWWGMLLYRCTVCCFLRLLADLRRPIPNTNTVLEKTK